MAEHWRARLRDGRHTLREAYAVGMSPGRLLHQHARLIDRVLVEVWRALAPVRGGALVATGGYGRGELFPHSDVDLLVLLAREPSPQEHERLAKLIGLLWDIGIEAGHSVRTVES
ncbi:MAG: hypothetical protein EPN19_09935 [Betaproteobacteria bacterium]|nr:MAG: hypothetical protein EPN19_09935 [Betaproteobacteria bacterium]